MSQEIVIVFSHLVTGSVVGIQLPGPSTLYDSTVCQSTSASSVTPATMATSVLLPTPNIELPRVVPALPSMLLEDPKAPSMLLKAPTTTAPSVLPATPTTKVTSKLPETPTVSKTCQTVKSVPAPSISATRTSSIIPPVPTTVSQAGSLTLRITPSGVKSIASHMNSHSQTICSMNGQPDSSHNLISLQSGSFALLQFPEQKDVSSSTVKQNVCVGVNNTDLNAVHLEEKAGGLQEMEAVESEVTMPDTKPKENTLPANQPDSHSEEMTGNINTITSDLPEKRVEIMEQLLTGPPILQPDMVSSDHTYMSEKSKCEEVKMKQNSKHSESIPGKASCSSETIYEECSQIEDLPQNTLQEQKHTRQLAESKEGEQMHVEKEEGVMIGQKQLDKQKVHMNCTEKEQKKIKSALQQNHELEMNTKEEKYSVATEWDQEEAREIPKNNSAKDKNSEIETKNASYTQEILHASNKKNTTDNLEENQNAKDSPVQVNRTWNKRSRQSVALKSRNSMDSDEQVAKQTKWIDQNTPKTNHKRKDSKLIIDITMDDAEKDEKTDDSADEMVDEVSGNQSEDTMNVETLVSI